MLLCSSPGYWWTVHERWRLTLERSRRDTGGRREQMTDTTRRSVRNNRKAEKWHSLLRMRESAAISLELFILFVHNYPKNKTLNKSMTNDDWEYSNEVKTTVMTQQKCSGRRKMERRMDNEVKVRKEHAWRISSERRDLLEANESDHCTLLRREQQHVAIFLVFGVCHFGVQFRLSSSSFFIISSILVQYNHIPWLLHPVIITRTYCTYFI